MGAGVLIKGETNRSPDVPIQLGKPLASQQQDVGGDIRVPVLACTDVTLDWKLNSLLRPCSSQVCACQ